MDANPRATYLASGVAGGAIGAAVVAGLGGLCHLAEPLVLGLGTNIFTLAHGVEPYRTLFLFGSAGLLLFGFGMTYATGLGPSGGRSMRVASTGRSALWTGATIYAMALAVPLIAKTLLS